MGRILLFTLVGFLLIALRRVDMLNGLFIIDGPILDLRNEIMLLGIIILCIAVTISLSLRERIKIFIYLSAFDAINHVIWFGMNEIVPYSQIPIKDSTPYFLKQYELYMRFSGVETIMYELCIGILITFNILISIMLIILDFKKGYEKIKDTLIGYY
jgi:hypothetical protein